MAFRTWVPLIPAFITFCLASSPASAGRQDWDTSAPGWASGPAWYLMTDDEYRSFRYLRSGSERSTFIRQFWDKRDPIPDTEENELEREFWDRVRKADAHFGQNVKPGWKTERGKLFILLGPPENYETDRIHSDVWGAKRWIYDLGSVPSLLRPILADSLGIPAGRRTVSVQVREETAGTRAVTGGAPIPDTVLRPTGSLPLAEELIRRFPSPGALRKLGYLMRVPELGAHLDPKVNVTTVFNQIPVQARVDFRPGGQDPREATTAVAVTLGVRESDLVNAGLTSPAGSIIGGSLTAVDGASTHPLAGTFQADPGWKNPYPEHGSGGYNLVFQAIAALRPGRYMLELTYDNVDAPIKGSLRDTIDVPLYSGAGLSLSSIILSSRLDVLEKDRAGAAADPFVFGRYRVIPRTSRVYGEAGVLTVFYEIYGTRSDGDRPPLLDLTYQFHIEDRGSWLPVGAPITYAGQSETEQAWMAPLEGWPEGRYRLDLKVVDRRSMLEARRSVLFEIASE